MLKPIFTAGAVLLAGFIVMPAFGQDWYHDRDMRFQDQHWRGQVFAYVRQDLEHIGSAAWAAPRERHRIERTEHELTDLQGKMQDGHVDRGELSDVIDSVTKSADDQRLSPRDRDVLHDDAMRLREYRDHHEHWNH